MSSYVDLRQDGNTFYKNGEYERARECYTNALEQLDIAESDDGSFRSQLLSNRAQAHLQERNYAAALQDARKALVHDSNNEKAWMRQVVALENLERFESAFDIVNKLLDTPGAYQQKPVAFQYSVTARRRLKQIISKDQAAARKEAKQIGAMVHEHQQLRINFGSTFPSQIPLETTINVVVTIGNEFGLFERKLTAERPPIQLQCFLRNNTDQRYKLYIGQEGSDEEDGVAYEDGRLVLNDRGKISFKMSLQDSSTEPIDYQQGLSLMVTVHDDAKDAWNLFSVVSLPFNVVPSTSEYVDDAPNDLGIHCCRAVQVSDDGQEVLLAESPGSLGIGGKLWDSSLVLTKYLSCHPEIVRGRRVVELGSGLGLVGIYCGLLGAKATLTDIEEVVPLLKYNLAVNEVESCSATTHAWGSELSEDLSAAEIVVASDVVYDPSGYAPLLASLDSLMKTDMTVAYLAHRSRHPMEHQFFTPLREAFAVEEIKWEGMAAASVLDDVKIFRLRKCR